MATIEGLRADVEAEVRKLIPVFENAAWEALEETREQLKKHVQKDVYDKWDPADYIRRGEDGGIIDIDYNTRINEPYIQTQNGSIAAGFDFNYIPSGDSYQWEGPYNGNWLIGRIESGEGYEWRNHPGPRPFWTNLVEELIGSNGYGDIVQRALAAQGVQIDGFAEVVPSRNGGNGEY